MSRHVDDLEVDAGPADGVDVAVVIDVIRAFTTAPWCLARGAARLLMAPSLEAAVEARRSRFPDAVLLKDGAPDPAFELPNSPGRIAREDLTGRVVVQRTGNGTRGAHAVSRVPTVLCASFVTATATARAVAASGARRLLLVPTEGDEDWALADLLTATLNDGGADPGPYLRRADASAAAQECRDRGPDDDDVGFDPDDLRRCLEIDAFDRAVRVTSDGELLSAAWHR